MSFGYQVLGFGSFPNRAGGYTVENAVWSDGSADELKLSQSAGTSSTELVYSQWFKRSVLGQSGNFITAKPGSGELSQIYIGNSGETFGIGIYQADNSGDDFNGASSALYRDTTAWTHLLVSYRTQEGAAADRIKVYVNGTEAPFTWTTSPGASQAVFLTSAYTTYAMSGGAGSWFGGYSAEVIYLNNVSVQGGGVAVSDFGELDANGVWVPVDPSGLAFGDSTDFWLNFADSTNFGLDVSGNTNNFASIGAAESTTINMTEASDTQFGLTNTANVRVGTSFTLASATSISRIQVACGRLSGGTGNCYCEIYNATGTVGTNAKGTGTALAISEAQDVSTWSTASGHSGYTWTYFDFATPVTLAAGDYVFAFDSDTSNDLYFWSENYGSQASNLTIRDASSVWTGANTYFQNFVMKGHSVIPAAQQVTDSPTDDADNDIGNFSLINAITPTAITLSEGNQRCAGTDQKLIGNIAVGRSSGVKLVVEFEIVAVANWSHLGMIGLGNGSLAEQYWDNDGTWRLNYNSAGNFQFGGTDSSSPASYTTGDFIRMEADFDNNSVEFFKNNVSQGTITISTTYDQWVWGKWLQGSGGDVRINTGQRAWNNTPTAGFVGWGTANLAAPTIRNPSDHFKTIIYEGTGAELSTGDTDVPALDFQPDLVWIKNREQTDQHMLYDSVREATKDLHIGDHTGCFAETTTAQTLKSFDANGFTLGTDVQVNTNNENYVAWCWKAGGAPTTDNDNTSGAMDDGSVFKSGVVQSSYTPSGSPSTYPKKMSIASHGGFSIVEYVGTGSNATVPHGLDSSPGFFTTKPMTQAHSWSSYHSSFGATDNVMYLDTIGAAASQSGAAWQSNPLATDNVITLGTQTGVNESGIPHIMYSWAKVPGLIGIGSYTGNVAANGPYVVVDDGASGFRPAWVMIKRTDVDDEWVIIDDQRSPYNVTKIYNAANYVDAERTTGTQVELDFTANGFKVRVDHARTNASGGTYSYLAFAEDPFGGSGVAQARAR